MPDVEVAILYRPPNGQTQIKVAKIRDSRILYIAAQAAIREADTEAAVLEEAGIGCLGKLQRADAAGLRDKLEALIPAMRITHQPTTMAQ